MCYDNKWDEQNKIQKYIYSLRDIIIPSPVESCVIAQKGKLLLRGTIVNRTYNSRHKNLHISLFSPTIFGPINYGPPE